LTGCPRRFLFRSVSIFAIEARALTVTVTVTVRPGTTVVAVVSTDLFLASLGEFIVALILVTLIIALATRVLFLEPRAALAQHAEIMVGELQVIFGLDAVARKLRVARHALVFLEQLGGVAALAIVLPVARLATEVLPPLAAAAAPAAALTIIDQIHRPYAVS